MATSIAQLRGPVRPVDWEQRIASIDRKSQVIRSDCRDTRSHTQQDELDVISQSRWAMHVSQVDLARRVEELSGLRRNFDKCLGAIIEEKTAMEKLLNATEYSQDDLRSLLNVIKECRVHRDERHTKDLVDDDVHHELEQSQQLAAGNLRVLQDQCRDIRTQVHDLIRVQHRLEKALHCIESTIELDRDQIVLGPRSVNVSLKPEPNRQPAGIMSLECWEHQASAIMNQAEDALRRFRALAEAVLGYSVDLNQNITSRREAVSFALRKRIHVQQQAVSQLQWQHDWLFKEVERMSRNVSNMERLTDSTLAPLKVAHTRLENRADRCRQQLCHDQAQESLLREVCTWDDSRSTLINRTRNTRTSLYELGHHFEDVRKELDQKKRSLNVDQQCFDIWKRFKERPLDDADGDNARGAPYMANLPVPLATRPSLGWVAPW